ncbi:MAG: hypothetical protein K8R36_19395 [Planctomycetales bacterium]|nr:hypothetical protein [Planctomycetales bacterium]
MKRILYLAAAILLVAGFHNQASAHGWRWRCSSSYYGGNSYYGANYSYYPESCNYYQGNYYQGYGNYNQGYGYGAYPSYGPGGFPGPSIMNVLGMAGLGGPSTGQSTYLSLPVGVGYGQTGYLQVPVGNTAGRGSYLQMPVNNGFGPPTFMQIELGRNTGDTAPAPSSRSSGSVPGPSPGPAYGTESSMLGKFTANIPRTNDDDVPPVAVGTETKGVALAQVSKGAVRTEEASKASEETAIQFVSTTLPVSPTARKSTSTSFSLAPRESEAKAPTLPHDDGLPWVVK